MLYLFAKALHMVGFVSWFAGLFYIVRLYIYHVENAARPEPERSLMHAQYMLMERRLWKAITVPAMVITVVFGGPIGAFYLMRMPLASSAWLLVKLGLVGVLLVYHFICGSIRKQLAAGTCAWTSPRLRMWNELATFLLVAIVMLAVFKFLFNAVWGTLALVGFAVMLGAAVRLLRKRATAS